MKTQDNALLYDVVAVNLSDNKVAALYGENKTLRNAEAIVAMAVMRQGCDERFFAEVPHGKFKVGDAYAS